MVFAFHHHGDTKLHRLLIDGSHGCITLTERCTDTADEAALELALCLPQTEDAHSEALARELGAAISAFLRTQKAEHRTAFLRRYWYCDSVEQTAAHMGWTVSKTKTVLFRTRNGLWDYLSKEGFL